MKKNFWKLDAGKFWLSAWKRFERFTMLLDPFVQTLMLTPCFKEIGQIDVKKLPTRKIYLKRGTIKVQICLGTKIFMVPSDQISQNEGS